MPTPIPPTPSDVVQAAVGAAPPAKVSLTPVDQNVHQAVKQLHTLNSDKYAAKCHGLSFAGGSTQGKCAAGGQHEHGGSWDFCMLHGNDHPTCQKNWHWCSKCQGLAFSGNGAGHCPAGGGHVTTGSAEYSLPYQTS